MKISAVTLAAVITAAATGTTAIPVDDPSNNHVVTRDSPLAAARDLAHTERDDTTLDNTRRGDHRSEERHVEGEDLDGTGGGSGSNRGGGRGGGRGGFGDRGGRGGSGGGGRGRGGGRGQGGAGGRGGTRGRGGSGRGGGGGRGGAAVRGAERHESLTSTVE